jgi:hypothetical protein
MIYNKGEINKKGDDAMKKENKMRNCMTCKYWEWNALNSKIKPIEGRCLNREGTVSSMLGTVPAETNVYLEYVVNLNHCFSWEEED